jgi:lambda family phage portal protein
VGYESTTISTDQIGSVGVEALPVVRVVSDNKPDHVDNRVNTLKTQLRTYQAAQTDRHNQNQWVNATGSDADAFVAPAIATLRNRSRWIYRNSALARGIIDTFANDVVGNGPRLQFIPEVEDKFEHWATEADITGMRDLTGDLRLDIVGQLTAGSSLAAMVSTRKPREVTDSPVTLRIQRIEPDRLQSPYNKISDPKFRSGIEIDSQGRPKNYYVLKNHPGSQFLPVAGFSDMDFDKVAAHRVIHLYKEDESNQYQGVPWITPSIPLFAQLKRFIAAVLAAAETAADLSGVLQSAGDVVDPEEVETFDTFDIERNMIMTLPAGWKVDQFKPEQPASTFKEFRREIINEIARPLNMPFNIAAGNSEGYNYSSSQSDFLLYMRFVRWMERWLERRKLNRVLFLWLREAMLIEGFLTDGTKNKILSGKVKPAWLWTSQEPRDEIKHAKAQETKLKNGSITLHEIWSGEGKDPERQREKLSEEIEWFEAKGIRHPLGKAVKESSGKAMEEVKRAVQSGVPIAVTEARARMGLPPEPPAGELLRFNDQDVLAYHIKSGILTINEVRKVLGWKAVPWGDVPIRDSNVITVDIESGEIETGEQTTEETDIESNDDERGTITVNMARKALGYKPVSWGGKLVSREYQEMLEWGNFERNCFMARVKGKVRRLVA